MSIERIFAHVSCSDLDESAHWYEQLFARPADASPMDHLREWHEGDQAGLQLFEDSYKAGQSTLTLIVTDAREDFLRLKEAGLNPGEVERGGGGHLVKLADPDGNLVVLAEPAVAQAAA